MAGAMSGAVPDCVIGLDSSTQSTKAIVWTREGEALAEGRAPIALSRPAPGRAEQDPEDWWRAAVTALRTALAEVDPRRIAGLAISNQRETVAFLDQARRPVMPAIVWLDERAAEEIEGFATAVGAAQLHELTGKPPDLTPVVYRLAWLRRHHPERLEQARWILDVQGFLAARLTGVARASWTSADPFGLFDIRRKAWSEPLLTRLGLSLEVFPPAQPPGTLIGAVSEAAAAATGLAAGTPLFAAGGDGQCAGLGVDAVRPGIVYLNLGTALVTGTWSAEPAIDRAWRSLVSPTGEGYFLESVQRAGAFLLDWFIDGFAGGRADPSAFARLEAQAARLPIGAEGALASPYLCGSMDPHWDPRARAAFVGLSAAHGPAHLYRACLEALTLESARAVATMARRGLGPRCIRAVGGGAGSALWIGMMADATGLPVERSRSDEASALGAGMTAAVGAGWFSGFGEAAAAMSSTTEAAVPNPAVAASWQQLSQRQARLYPALRSI